MKTAILGGGLTGITLARLLYECGEDVIVLEREAAYGGLCRSHSESGFTFDVGGSHIIFSRDAEVLGFMLEQLGANRNENSRNTKVYYKGRYIKYPFENGLSGLPREDLFYCINEFIKTLIASEKGELKPPSNFQEWIVHTFGRGIAETYLIPYNEKIWKFPTDKMSHHWVEGRIPRPPVEDVIRSAIGIETEGYTHQSRFHYPLRGGIETLIRSIAAPLQDAIRTGFAVSSVRGTEGDWIVGDGDEEIRCERIISTIPLQQLLGSLDGVPEDVGRACRELKYNSLATICIGVRGRVPGISWMYVPQAELGLFNRLSFPSNFSPEVAPPGHASILAEVTYRQGDEVATMPDSTLIQHTLDGLERMEILSRSDVVYTRVERQKYAYVIYDLDYPRNIAKVKEYCARRRIGLVGRFAEFEYLNMDGCIRNAMNYVGARRCA
ncbi:MAG: FAD-dependent oxidoreductase [Methanomicrobiales archaeon]|nr:FAD-dependent oxidoreductase [Methanomicrobiales archaeon]